MKWYGLFLINKSTHQLLSWEWCAPEDMIVSMMKMRFDDYCVQTVNKLPNSYIYVCVNEGELE